MLQVILAIVAVCLTLAGIYFIFKKPGSAKPETADTQKKQA